MKFKAWVFYEKGGARHWYLMWGPPHLGFCLFGVFVYILVGRWSLLLAKVVILWLNFDGIKRRGASFLSSPASFYKVSSLFSFSLSFSSSLPPYYHFLRCNGIWKKDLSLFLFYHFLYCNGTRRYRIEASFSPPSLSSTSFSLSLHLSMYLSIYLSYPLSITP